MNLLDGITSTAATKVPFTLSSRDFVFNSTPMLKSSGLGSGDSVLIWEWVNGAWHDTGVTLVSTQTSRIVDGTGKYAVTAALSTSGPVSCELNTSRQ
jgi:hypothetical protein